MAKRTHHHTGEAPYTALAVNEHYTFIIPLQCARKAGIDAGSILAMPAGIQPGFMIAFNQNCPGLGAPFLKGFNQITVIAVMSSRAIQLAQPTPQTVFGITLYFHVDSP